MELKVKTESGHITSINVDELLEVDGKPFRHSDETDYLTAQIAELRGRLNTIERAIWPAPEPEGVTNG